MKSDIVNEKIAYLTFDDVPNTNTNDILNTLKANNIKATFFIVGSQISKYESIIKDIYDNGHTIGLHSMSHDKLNLYKTVQNFLTEMDNCNKLIKSLTGKDTKIIRAPYGSYPYMNNDFRNSVKSRGYILWDWNVDSTDALYKHSNALNIISATHKRLLFLESKDINPIILFHSTDFTNEALISTIQTLRFHNYSIEPLNTDLPPITLWDNIEKNYDIYTVRPGDNIWRLSRLNGLTESRLMKINGLLNDTIYDGQTIYLYPKQHLITNTTSNFIVRGNKFERNLALTFDSGFEEGNSTQVLDVLKKYNIHCTFFLTGLWVEKFPHLAKRIVSDGHEVANHSYDHPDMLKISYTKIINNLSKAEKTIKSITNVDCRPLFRAPYGNTNIEVLKAAASLGYRYTIHWSKDALDWQPISTNEILLRILTNVNNGDIFLMHIAGANTAEACDIAIKKLLDQGFNFVTVSRIL